VNNSGPSKILNAVSNAVVIHSMKLITLPPFSAVTNPETTLEPPTPDVQPPGIISFGVYLVILRGAWIAEAIDLNCGKEEICLPHPIARGVNLS
jgi:hypothetical protein